MIRKSIYIAINSLRKWVGSTKCTVLFIMLFTIVWSVMMPVTSLCRMTQYRVHPFLYVFFSNSIRMQLYLMAGLVFLFSDAPFMDNNQPFVMIRCGRYTWALGQVFYVIFATVLYFLIIIIFSIVILIPISTLATDGWGKIVNTLAYTDAAQQYDIVLSVSPKIVELYTPLQALSLTFLVQCLAGIFIGLLMFLINSITKSKIGNYVAALVVILDLLIYNMLPISWLYVSPASLSRLGIIDPTHTSNYPSMEYAILFFVINIVILSFLSALSIRKRQIDIIQDI